MSNADAKTPMKYAVMFRDERVQSIAETLFAEKDLKFLMVSKILPVTPTTAENMAAFREIVKEAEADIARAKQLLTLCDMAVALNGGSYERILRYSDSAEEGGEAG